MIVEPCRSAHMKAMEEAKKAGVLLSYDPNLRLPLWPSANEAREQIKSIWNKADIIKVSDDELKFLTQSEKVDDETAMSLWHDGLKLLLVTLGENGCRYYTKVLLVTHLFFLKCVDTVFLAELSMWVLIRRVVISNLLPVVITSHTWPHCLFPKHSILLTFLPLLTPHSSLQNFRGSVDPFKVKAVDTTGAGDSFVGALLCKIVDDQSVLQVLNFLLCLLK